MVFAADGASASRYQPGAWPGPNPAVGPDLDGGPGVVRGPPAERPAGSSPRALGFTLSSCLRKTLDGPLLKAAPLPIVSRRVEDALRVRLRPAEISEYGFELADASLY